MTRWDRLPIAKILSSGQELDGAIVASPDLMGDSVAQRRMKKICAELAVEPHAHDEAMFPVADLQREASDD